MTLPTPPASHLALALVTLLGSLRPTSGAAEGGGWVSNATLRAHAEGTRRRVPLKTYEVSLDDPPAHRWDRVAADFKQYVPAVQDYLNSFFPAWARPIVNAIGKDVRPYFKDYGEEMEGLASALDMPIGEIVIVNLIYQLEHIGINCSNWNNTGPTTKDDPGCTAVDPSQGYCYCHKHSELIREDGWLRLGDTDELKEAMKLAARTNAPGPQPGLCSSIVARDAQGNIYHGRNLDWNLPDPVLQLAANVNFTKGGQTVFVASTIVGFVGVFNGMKPEGFSVSINARGKGGKIITNLLEALLKHGMTPSQHLRMSLETQASFEDGINFLGSGPLIDEVYFITAGVSGNEGAVISRSRNEAVDIWRLNDTAWYRVQTNYDHWNPVPKADDRRNPEIESMEALGQNSMGTESMLSIITKWPAYNHHTDYTGVFAPFNGTYVSSVWRTFPSD